MYPPSITHATFLGTTLWDQCNTSFGYLQTKGFCPGGGDDCKVFPIVIGETGSAYEADDDKQWLQDFADFINCEVGFVMLARGCMFGSCVCCNPGCSEHTQQLQLPCIHLGKSKPKP